MVRMCCVFGVIGGGGADGKTASEESIGVVERVIPLGRAVEAYEKFERGEWGKVVFDPWA